MATVIARYPKTASGRAQALGHLDRLGRGAEDIHDTDDEIVVFVNDYAGDKAAAEAHFAGAAHVQHNALSAKPPKAGESPDWEPVIEVAGEVISRPASAREPQAPPEVQADPPGTAEDKHAPDTATEPSPGMSGAGLVQARRDKAAQADSDAPAKPKAKK